MPREQNFTEEEIENKVKEFQEWIGTRPDLPQNLGKKRQRNTVSFGLNGTKEVDHVVKTS